jgi:hypothetical protein
MRLSTLPCPASTSLHASNNQLTTLDVSKNIALTQLWVNDNQLTSLDVSNNTALTRLDVSDNYLKEVIGWDGDINGGSPIRLPQIASASNILAYAKGNSIVLQNLPMGAKIEVFGLNGKRVYSAHPENPLIGGIGVQTIEVHAKGMYIVKVSSGSVKQVLRVAVK